VRFEPPDLVNTIVDDAAGGDALPLLAYTLRELHIAAAQAGASPCTATASSAA
jgi:hypothetical protein